MGTVSHFEAVPTLIEQGVATVPEAYIAFPDGDVGAVQDGRIPVIDLLDFETADGRQRIVGEIQRAAEEWGFFEVLNHGVEEKVLDGVMQAARDFFGLPMEERMKLFSTEFNLKSSRYGTRLEETSVQDWRDFLSVWRCHPLDEDTYKTWPSSPPLFRTATAEYCEQIRALASKLILLASESLGLQPDKLATEFGPLQQTLLFNRYLPCPQPELVLGVRSHCDPGVANILLIDGVPGLQMRKGDGSAWVPINTDKPSLIVNFGDQVQVLSNGRYKSFEHRVLANPEKTRFSISTFFQPQMDATIQPLADLVDKDHPLQYRSLNFGEYVKTYLTSSFTRGTLEALQIR